MDISPEPSLIAVLALFVAVAWIIAAAFIARKKRGKYQEWVDQFDGRITFNEQGLIISKPRGSSSIKWSALVKVELAWSENPFGDPQYGPYCDTDWVLWSKTGNAMSITESVNETNSKTLLQAFAKYLPGFDFDYEKFNQTHKGRLSDLQGGREIIWMRNA